MTGKIKWLTLALALMLGTLPLKAGVPGKAADTPRSYEVAVMGIGGQNRTWGGYGGGALQASLPVLKNLDILTGIQGLSPGVMTGLLQIQPVFPLKKGELFADITGYYGGFYRYGVTEWLTALGAGWRAAHFSAQLGISVRWILDRDSSSRVVEPIDPVFRVAYSVKESSSPWNITGGVANYSRYEVERAMQPIFFLEGYYSVTKNLSVTGELNIKPAGMFHLVASWYGFTAGIGLKYRFAL
jgi:hypothetical protein